MIRISIKITRVNKNIEKEQFLIFKRCILSLNDTQLMTLKTGICYVGLPFYSPLPYSSHFLCSLACSLIISIVTYAYSFRAPLTLFTNLSSFTQFNVSKTSQFFIVMNSYGFFRSVLKIDVSLSVFQYSYLDSFSTNSYSNTFLNRIACSELLTWFYLFYSSLSPLISFYSMNSLVLNLLNKLTCSIYGVFFSFKVHSYT